MTDANLMDVFCRHGDVWWECEPCVKELNAALLCIEDLDATLTKEDDYGYLD